MPFRHEGEREQKRRELDQAIQAEIANNGEWLELLRSSRTNFFHIAEREESPFVYKTPVEDLVLRLEVMERHRGDEPGPDLAELRSRNDEGTLWQGED